MSLSFSSGPLSPSSSIHKTNHLTIDLSRAGTWNQCKSCVKGHYLSLHLSLPNFQENWMAMEKLGISFWKKIHHNHLSYFYLQGFYIATMIFKLTYTILHWRGGPCALLWACAGVNRKPYSKPLIQRQNEYACLKHVRKFSREKEWEWQYFHSDTTAAIWWHL